MELGLELDSVTPTQAYRSGGPKATPTQAYRSGGPKVTPTKAY
jgi:hypothetical protein